MSIIRNDWQEDRTETADESARATLEYQEKEPPHVNLDLYHKVAFKKLESDAIRENLRRHVAHCRDNLSGIDYKDDSLYLGLGEWNKLCILGRNGVPLTLDQIDNNNYRISYRANSGEYLYDMYFTFDFTRENGF